MSGGGPVACEHDWRESVGCCGGHGLPTSRACRLCGAVLVDNAPTKPPALEQRYDVRLEIVVPTGDSVEEWWKRHSPYLSCEAKLACYGAIPKRRKKSWDEQNKEVASITAPSPAPPEQPARTLDNRFHELWSQAVGSPRYVKDQWRALEGALVRSLDTRESEVLLRIAEIVVAHAQQPAEQPARGDGVRRVFHEESFEGECDVVDDRVILFNAGTQRDADIEFILRHRWVGKRVRVTLVEVLDDAPWKDGAK